MITVRTFLDEAIKSFVDDPADDDYQKGYLAALIELSNSIEDKTIETTD